MVCDPMAETIRSREENTAEARRFDSMTYDKSDVEVTIPLHAIKICGLSPSLTRLEGTCE